MSVTVSIPTILRTHTGGEKRVTATGDTLQAVISDLESNYSGISERLLDDGKLHRFVNIYVNDDLVLLTPLPGVHPRPRRARATQLPHRRRRRHRRTRQNR